MKTTLIWAIVCAALALGTTAQAAPRHKITVVQVTFDGWKGAYRISNGVVQAIVVPQISRIMQFEWVGRPESNPIFVNKDWVGKTIKGVPVTTWATFGGDKLWPSPQDDWPKHGALGWPPDRTFDGDPLAVQILPNGVKLTSSTSSAFAAHEVRTITMKPGQARLYIHQVLIKDPKAAGDKNGFPMGIWSITQTRGDGTIFLPISGTGKAGKDFYVTGGKPEWAAYPGGPAGVTTFWKPVGSMIVGRRDPVNSRKVGSKVGAGWLASLYSGNIVFSEHYQYQLGAPYPDTGLPAETYTNGGSTAYIEMEVLGPANPLKAGQSETYDVYWQLNHISHAPKDDAQACRLVSRVAGH